MKQNQILLTQNNFNKLKNEVKKAKAENKKIIFSSEDDELNRKILEKLQINILLISLSKRKDKFKQRNSGFNQVLAKLAKKKGITIGINLDEIIETKGEVKKDILARIKQNIKLCNKNKVQMDFVVLKEKNKRDVYDLRALGLVLGMPTKMISQIGKFF